MLRQIVFCFHQLECQCVLVISSEPFNDSLEAEITAQKMKLPVEDFFSKCDQIRSFTVLHTNIDGWMDGWMDDKSMDGWINGWMDG